MHYTGRKHTHQLHYNMNTNTKTHNTKPQPLKIVQLNMHHSKEATAELCRFVGAKNIDLALLQEPYAYNKRVAGLGCMGGDLIYHHGEENPRTCIFVSRRIRSLGITIGECFRDLVVIQLTLQMRDNKKERVALMSAYIPSEADFEPPTKELEEVTDKYASEGVPFIIGCDANSHHEVWGSTKCNVKGELLLEYIVSNNLAIINTGNTATFVTRARQEVLDITLASEEMSTYIKNWKVDEEESFSDHRRITFQIESIIEKYKIRNARKTDWVLFDQRMSEYTQTPEWDQTSTTDIENGAKRLETALLEAYHTACPLREVTNGKGQAWWNKALKKERKETRRALRKALKNNDDAHWDQYRAQRNKMRNNCRKESRKGWRSYCASISNYPEAARLVRALAGDKTCRLGSLKVDDELITDPNAVLRIMMSSHFPECTEPVEGEVIWRRQVMNSNDMKSIVSEELIEWSISTFAPYKAAGPDEIFPKMLQHAFKHVKKDLLAIYLGSLSTGYIPSSWRKIRAVFLPKPGKKTYQDPKSFRCISLSSFLLKTLEKLIDRNIREEIDKGKRPLHANQHAYMENKSTETALHNLVSMVEHTLDKKESAIGCFFDVEGAFDKATSIAIEASLIREGIIPPIKQWIMNMLNQRTVTAELGNTTYTVKTKRGFPQGGCLSPLMWCLLLDDLIANMDRRHIYMQAYSDDGVILAAGKDLKMLCSRMNMATKIAQQWCKKRGLNLNPDKTKVVLFTKKRKNKELPPIVIDGKTLEVVREIKYLGVTVDDKLLFNSHISQQCTKAKIAMMQCRRAIGNTWGLKPCTIHWIYKAIIIPRLLYGALVWWHRATIKTNQKKLAQVQRLAGLMTSGAFKTTPTAALEMILGLTPLDLEAKKRALEQCYRLKSFGLWRTIPTTKGHTRIIDLIEGRLSMIMANNDLVKKQKIFDKKYRVHIGLRDNWELMNDNKSTVCYTDGSRKESTGLSGAGIYIVTPLKTEEITINLGKFASVFQAETMAILECAHRTKQIIGQETDKVLIYSDSQAALKALEKPVITSALVRQCKTALNKLAAGRKVTLAWVPGHQGTRGNEKADELAREGADETFIGPEPCLPIPARAMKGVISKKIAAETNARWRDMKGCRQSKLFIRTLDKEKTKYLLQLKKEDIRMITGLVTGHCMLNRHLKIIGRTNDPSCPECGEEETSLHFLAECPMYSLPRWELLGTDRLEQEQLLELKLGDIIRFSKATRRFVGGILQEHQ